MVNLLDRLGPATVLKVSKSFHIQSFDYTYDYSSRLLFAYDMGTQVVFAGQATTYTHGPVCHPADEGCGRKHNISPATTTLTKRFENRH